MKAQLLYAIAPLSQNPAPLVLRDIPVPEPLAGEVLIQISVCAVCHTELDEIEGRLPPGILPVIPGHQVVGRVAGKGSGVDGLELGDRVGVGWIYSACGSCRFCRAGLENLCDAFLGTGKDANGGYAEFMTVPAAYAFPIPEALADAAAAPLMCAGAIGYRSLQLSGISNGDRLGLTGFGASGSLVLKMVKTLYPDTEVFVFARKEQDRVFAKELGADWAGDTTDRAPSKLRAIIDTTPAWKPVVEALANLDKGGRLVINAIRKEAGDQAYLQRLSYHEHLWLEREVKSVANIRARDIREFLELAANSGIRPDVREFRLEEANIALLELKKGGFRGSKLLLIQE